MKRVIDGKAYNTETATEIADYSNDLGSGDFRNISESLYITTKGNFFLAGEGGPMTKYSQPCGNMTGGGEGIIPLSKDEALAWAEAHADGDVIEEYFSDLIEEA